MSLFFPLVPHGGEDDEDWLTAGFEDTEESTDGDKTSKVAAGSVESQNGTPENNVCRKVFGDWYSLDNVICRISSAHQSVTVTILRLHIRRTHSTISTAM